MSVYGWGSNRFGELGTSTEGTKHEPSMLNIPEGCVAVEVASGEGHSLVLTESGQVYAFGKGNEGQLGLGGKSMLSREPRLVESIENETVVKIAAGARSSFAVTAAGTVYVWGLVHRDEYSNDDVNTGGFVGLRADRADNIVQVDAEARMAAGNNRRAHPGAPRHVREIVKESTERWLSANQDADLEYIAEMQAIGYQKEEAEEIMQRRDSEYSSMLMMNTRRFPVLQPQLIRSLHQSIRIVSVSAGYAHCMLLSDKGHLFTSGYNDRGQLGLGHRISTSEFKQVHYLDGKMVLKVVCGHQHTLCIAIDRALASSYGIISITNRMVTGGVLYSWGNGVLGQLGLGLKGTSKGRILPTVVDTMFELYPNQIVDIGAGANFSAALTACGKVYTWGHGEYNQHGTGATLGSDYIDHFYYFYPRELKWPSESADAPVVISSISCGDNFSLAITEHGEVYSWGWHDFGVLGHGKGYFLSSPSPVVALQPARTGGRVTSISCGANHAMAVVATGSEYSKAFAGLINDERTADAALVIETLDAANGKKEDYIYCHKSILSARSRYFRGYFQADLKRQLEVGRKDTAEDSLFIFDEKKQSSRRITKVYLPVAQLSHITGFALLDFIYTDKFNVVSHRRAELGALAHYIGLDELSSCCKVFGITHAQQSTFEADVHVLLKDAMFSDIVFTSSKCKGDEENTKGNAILGFAHSVFLKRIPFFESMLSGDYHQSTTVIDEVVMTEVNLDDILLEGVDQSIFFKILAYIYSGFISTLEISDLSEVMHILVTSSNLGITRLASFCEKELSLHLADHPDNAHNCFEFAMSYNFPRLAQQCKHYTDKNENARAFKSVS